jgi:F-type H+-transporting ATPase subunit epsilon
MKTFHLTIAKVGERVFDGEAQSVVLPGAAGVFTVLANHEPMVAGLTAGEAKVKDAAGAEHRFPVAATGVAEVSRNQATVLI